MILHLLKPRCFTDRNSTKGKSGSRCQSCGSTVLRRIIIPCGDRERVIVSCECGRRVYSYTRKSG